jgi:hypothetical protein
MMHKWSDALFHVKDALFICSQQHCNHYRQHFSNFLPQGTYTCKQSVDEALDYFTISVRDYLGESRFDFEQAWHDFGEKKLFIGNKEHKIIQLPLWKFETDDLKQFQFKFTLFNHKIYLLETNGHAWKEDIVRLFRIFEQILSDTLPPHQHCTLIQDLTHVKNASLGARKIYSQWFKRNLDYFSSVIVFGMNTKMTSIVNMGKKLSQSFSSLHTAKDLQASFELIANKTNNTAPTPVHDIQNHTIPWNRKKKDELIQQLLEEG